MEKGYDAAIPMLKPAGVPSWLYVVVPDRKLSVEVARGATDLLTRNPPIDLARYFCNTSEERSPTITITPSPQRRNSLEKKASASERVVDVSPEGVFISV